MGDSKRLLSEVFERKADYFMLTTSSEKNFSLIASRKEKNTRNTVKITFSCGNYNIFTFLSCCLPETRTKDQIRGPRIDHRKRLLFCEFQAKYLCLELETSGLSTGKFLCLYNLFSYPFFYSNSLQNPKIGMCNQLFIYSYSPTGNTTA